MPLVKDTYASERRKAKTLNFSIAYGKVQYIPILKKCPHWSWWLYCLCVHVLNVEFNNTVRRKMIYSICWLFRLLDKSCTASDVVNKYVCVDFTMYSFLIILWELMQNVALRLTYHTMCVLFYFTQVTSEHTPYSWPHRNSSSFLSTMQSDEITSLPHLSSSLLFYATVTLNHSTIISFFHPPYSWCISKMITLLHPCTY